MTPTATTAVLLIAHGSRHAPANDDLHRLAEAIAATGAWPIVAASFLELADPDIATAGAGCVAQGASRVLMIPYFLSAGVHLIRDLTAAREALRARFAEVQFLLGPPLGPHRLLEALVHERVKELDEHGPPPDLASPGAMAVRYAPMADHAAGPGWVESAEGRP